jgi:hypothetical protein
MIPTAQYRPSKQQNSNCKPFPFHLEFGIPTQFNSRNHFYASKQSVRVSGIMALMLQVYPSWRGSYQFHGTKVVSFASVPVKDRTFAYVPIPWRSNLLPGAFS